MFSRDTLSRSLQILCLLGIFTASYSQTPVLPGEAAQVATNWLQLGQELKWGWEGTASFAAKDAQAVMYKGELIGYCFAATDGYMVLPAYRELPPISAYSVHGRFDVRLEHGMVILMKELLNYKIDLVRTYLGQSTPVPEWAPIGDEIRTNNELWADYSNAYDTFIRALEESNEQLNPHHEGGHGLDEAGPLLVTTGGTISWHQNLPFNLDCPIGDAACTSCPAIGGGSPYPPDPYNCLAGCVAIAYAQIMRYWHFPVSGVGTHSYTWSGDASCNHTPSTTVLATDFSQPFNWSGMLPHYTGNETAGELLAVARLCYNVGVVLNMNYGRCWSGANITTAIQEFPEHFGYSNAMEYVQRQNHPTVSEWISLLQEDLNASPGRPIVYAIFSHAIACDGWRGAGTIQLHFNYGWDTDDWDGNDGTSDGWVTLDNLYCPWQGCSGQVESAVRHIMPARLTLNLDPRSVNCGTAFLCQARVYDANGNPLSGHGVTFTADDFPGSFNATQATTNAQGLAQVAFTPSSGGNGTISVSHEGQTATAPFDVACGGIRCVTTPVPTGGSWQYRIEVQLLDQSNEPIGYTDFIFSTSAGSWSTGGTSAPGRTDQMGRDDATLIIPSTTYPNGTDVTLIYTTAMGDCFWNGHLGGTPDTLCSFQLSSTGNEVAIAWSSDGSMVATGGTRAIRLWNPATWQLVREIALEYGNEVLDLDFSPDGTRIVALTTRIYLVNTSTGAILYQGPNTYGEECVDWSPNGQYIVMGDHTSYMVYLFNASLTQLASYSTGHSVVDIQFSPITNQLAAAIASTSEVRLLQYTASSLSLLRTISMYGGSSDNPRALCYSPDGMQLVVGGDEQPGAIYNTADGSVVRGLIPDYAVHHNLDRVVWCPVASPSHPYYNRIVGGQSSHTIIYNAATGSPEGHADFGLDDQYAAWAPNGYTLIGADGVATYVVPLDDHTPPVVNVTSHTNGQLVYTDQITLAGVITDANRIKHDSIYVNANPPFALSLDAAGAFNQNVTLVPGSNSVIVTAQDGACNRSTVPLSIIRYSDIVPPQVLWVHAQPEQQLLSGNLTITAKAYDGYSGLSGLSNTAYITRAAGDTFQTVSLYDDATHGDGSAGDSVFTVVLPLGGFAEAVYGIDFKATDAADNSTREADVAQFVAFAYPVISNISLTPSSPTAQDSAVVTATITDAGTVAAANLYYSTNGGSTYINAPMVYRAGVGDYRGVIPPQTRGVRYFILAVDGFNYRTSSDTLTYRPGGIVSDLTAVLNGNAITLNWTADPNAVAYHVYVGDSVNFIPGAGTLRGTVTTNTFSDTNTVTLRARRFYAVTIEFASSGYLDRFDDGNYSSNPAWISYGSAQNIVTIDGNYCLEIYDPNDIYRSMIGVPAPVGQAFTLEFDIRRRDPSSTLNNLEVGISSGAPDLESSSRFTLMENDRTHILARWNNSTVTSANVPGFDSRWQHVVMTRSAAGQWTLIWDQSGPNERQLTAPDSFGTLVNPYLFVHCDGYTTNVQGGYLDNFIIH